MKIPKRQKLQETVKVKDWGEPSINRLAVVLKSLEQMDERERSAIFGLLRSKYAAEWPREQF